MSAVINIYGFNSTKPVSGKLVRSGKTGPVFFLGDNSTLYTTRHSKGFQQFTKATLVRYFGPGECEALCRLGVTTRVNIRSGKAEGKKREAKQTRDRHIALLKKAAHALGIPMPKIPRVKT